MTFSFDDEPRIAKTTWNETVGYYQSVAPKRSKFAATRDPVAMYLEANYPIACAARFSLADVVKEYSDDRTHSDKFKYF